LLTLSECILYFQATSFIYFGGLDRRSIQIIMTDLEYMDPVKKVARREKVFPDDCRKASSSVAGLLQKHDCGQASCREDYTYVLIRIESLQEESC
jgi:hypothetical protein